MTFRAVFLAFSALCLLTFTACDNVTNVSTASGVGDDDPDIDALFANWDEPGSPGCAVAISRDGETVYSRGYGYANLDLNVAVTPSTVFDIASVTKQFVASSVSMLVQEGKLAFDDDVRKYLPELPVYEQPITLRHMLYHTSGLRDYLTLFPLAGRNDYYPISHQQILDMVSRQRALIFTPGEREEYSNTAYMLLAIVVERVSGQSLGDFVNERIYQPLQMRDSLMYDNLERVIERRATGYVKDEQGVRITHISNFDVPGDGQMYSTVEDLLLWNKYLHGEDGPAFYDVLLEPARLNDGSVLQHGKGLYFDKYRGVNLINHTGSSWGFQTALIHFVESSADIAISCNDDLARPYDIALRIADHLFANDLAPVVAVEEVAEKPEKDEVPLALSMTSEQLQEFSGTFYSPELDAIYRLDTVDGNLEIRIEQELPIRAAAVGKDRFQFQFGPAGWSWEATVELEFQRDKQGRTLGFLMSAYTERGIEFEKIELPQSGVSH